MGIRNTPAQQRAYNAQSERRRKAAGFERHGIIVHRDDWPRVKALVDELRRQREDSQACESSKK